MRGSISVDAVKSMAEHFTIKVRMRRVREARIRVWLASAFIRLAALILGCGIEMEKK